MRSALSRRKVGLDVSGVDLAMSHVGSEKAHEARAPRRLGRRKNLEPIGACLASGPAVGAGPDDHGDPAVTQVQRMGAPLAAITDDGDRPALQHSGLASSSA